jgi:hypothetical protein
VTPADADPALRRFERDAVGACLAMAVVAFVAVALARDLGGAARAGLGVVGGGLLMAFSYRAIKGGVDLLVAGIAAPPPGSPPAGRRIETVERTPAGGQLEAGDGAAGDRQSEPDSSLAAPPALSLGRRAFLVVKFFTRYALLAVAAYVMLTCFRLHPVGLLAGATAPFLAAVVQAARMSRAGGRHP